MAVSIYRAKIVSFNATTGTGKIRALAGGTAVSVTNFMSWNYPGFNPMIPLRPEDAMGYSNVARTYLPTDSPYKYTLTVSTTYAYNDEVVVMDNSGAQVILGTPTAVRTSAPVQGAPTDPIPTPPSPPALFSGRWRDPVADLTELNAIENPLIGQTHFVQSECAHYVFSEECDGWIKSGGGGNLETPTDGEFGGLNGNISGIAEGDTYDDAFDKIETVLGLLAPKKPKRLGEVVLELVDAYTARTQGTGTLQLTVVDSLRPVARTTEPFGDGKAGILAAKIAGASIGLHTLTTGNDAGLYDGLSILSDVDPYAGQFGKAGFYEHLLAQLSPTTDLALGTGHYMELMHSLTGTVGLTAYPDDPLPPVVTPGAVTAAVVGDVRHVSGIPCLKEGDTVTADFTAADTISEFFHPDRITEVESTIFYTVASPLPLAPAPNKGDVIASGLLTGSVRANVFSANAPVHMRAYNSKGVPTTATVYNNLRADTRSDETKRLKSGIGQFPNFGALPGEFGDVYDSLASLQGNEELQLENGEYRYPALIDYSGLYPTPGPNYSALPAGSHNSLRWVTFELGQVVNANSVTFEIDGASNFGNLPLVPGCEMYLKVEGATGWLNANAAYPGVGDPTNNGAAALAISLSTALKRYVTFGTTVRTGTVYVRIGLPPGSNKRFVGVTKL